MTKIYSAIACNYDVDIVSASIPLLEQSKVEAVEWSFDSLFNYKEIPDWFLDLLRAFSNENKLIGHGVFFSLLSGKWTAEQQNWLLHLKQLSLDFKFDHITEHFGFMTGRNFHHGTPLSIPYSRSTLNIGRDRLARIHEACRCPVGLENLAFSYSIHEVKQHGDFLEKLIEPINGFIILDLHNIYCQVHNFNIPFDEIIVLYPLEKVREIHISGGSWEDSTIVPKRKIRRDTHDQVVPKEVFEFLKSAIEFCPNLKYVVFEQLGNGLKTKRSKSIFYEDFLRMENIVKNRNAKPMIHQTNPFLPLQEVLPGPIIEDEILGMQQQELSNILDTSNSYDEAIIMLHSSSLANSEWKIENWEPSMIETALNIAQKWKKKEQTF